MSQTASKLSWPLLLSWQNCPLFLSEGLPPTHGQSAPVSTVIAAAILGLSKETVAVARMAWPKWQINADLNSLPDHTERTLMRRRSLAVCLSVSHTHTQMCRNVDRPKSSKLRELVHIILLFTALIISCLLIGQKRVWRGQKATDILSHTTPSECVICLEVIWMQMTFDLLAKITSTWTAKCVCTCWYFLELLLTVWNSSHIREMFWNQYN